LGNGGRLGRTWGIVRSTRDRVELITVPPGWPVRIGGSWIEAFTDPGELDNPIDVPVMETSFAMLARAGDTATVTGALRGIDPSRSFAELDGMAVATRIGMTVAARTAGSARGTFKRGCRIL
jgi:hypothetical protein